MVCSSMPGFPVLHCLPEFAQTYIHWVNDAIQPSLLCPSSSCPESFPASGYFPMSQLFRSHGESIRASASAWVLRMNIQGWFSLVLTGLISLLSKGLSSLFQFENINFSVLSLLYGPTLTSVPDYWQNHSLDHRDVFRQSDVSAF